MPIPSFSTKDYSEGPRGADIFVLEVSDRQSPEGPPIGWVLIEREVEITPDADGSVYEAKLKINYEAVDAHGVKSQGGGQFQAGYSKRYIGQGPSCSLSTTSYGKGTIFMDIPRLKGNRIGTFLMYEITTWLRQWPDADVRRIELAEGQGDDSNKGRRNRMYEKLGLIFDYKDSTCRAGLSRPMKAGDLLVNESWKENIKVIDVRSLLSGLSGQIESLKIEETRWKRAYEFSKQQWEAEKAVPWWKRLFRV